MRLREFTNKNQELVEFSLDSLSAPLFKRFGPAVYQTALNIIQGHLPDAAISALQAGAKALNLPMVKWGVDIAEDLRTLWSIATSSVSLGIFLATYSGGLNAGEDAEIEKMRQDYKQPQAQKGSVELKK